MNLSCSNNCNCVDLFVKFKAISVFSVKISQDSVFTVACTGIWEIAESACVMCCFLQSTCSLVCSRHSWVTVPSPSLLPHGEGPWLWFNTPSLPYGLTHLLYLCYSKDVCSEEAKV